MTMDLTQKRCIPCEGGVPALSGSVLKLYQGEIPSDWKLSNDSKRIEKVFTFKNFSSAMKFVNRVAALAEEEGHHPDIHISFKRVRFELWTHAIDGLSENDFILAAKIEELNS